MKVVEFRAPVDSEVSNVMPSFLSEDASSDCISPTIEDSSHNTYASVNVPSEGDFMIAKGKVNEPAESEGMRKKKKKIEQGNPRPACSWVHFSQEFIKKYAASHPESSGLKAATKAASEAWKSMNQEEKEKYTKRAREVWDNYLSVAPARAPKPRKQTKLVTRCSPGRLFNVLQRLTPEQKMAVKSMGFGSLLGLRCRTLRRSLCLWLLERFDTAGCSLEICGEHIPLSPKDVEHVMGLTSSGKDVVNSGPHKLIANLRQSYSATNCGISVRLLEERLTAPEAGEDFKRSFVLYALGTLLSPTARLDVSPSFLHFLINMNAVHQYNWGKFLLDRLVREVSRFHQGKQRAVGGCLLFLQLFYYESIHVEGASAFISTVVPCLSSWGEEEITEREKREKELGGYGFGEVMCKERCFDANPPSLLSTDKLNSEAEHFFGFVQEENGINLPDLTCTNTVCGDIEVVAELGESQGRNKEFEPNGTHDYLNTDDNDEMCVFSPCACPLPDCNFVGSSEQLSLHFSSKHWDSGRRFRYNSPLSVSLGMEESFLVLQAEEDGILFLLNKGTESIGNMVMITCVGHSGSKEKFLYNLIAGKGVSSLRLKSMTEYFPGRVEGTPSMDFLLIPFHFHNSLGQLDLEVCIWNSTELGAECS